MQPVRILVNYWEWKPTQAKERLDELVQNGVTEIATFVPWQAFESDISHSLYRFIQTCWSKKLHLSLLPCPEPGIHYRYSGIPKELVQKEKCQAVDSRGKSIPFLFGPQAMSAPSLFSTEFKKRLYGYLSRFHVFLTDIHRNHPKLLERVSVDLSGSFWKYYRSPLESAWQPFDGRVGDFSKDSTLAYRKGLDQFFMQSEFVGKLNPSESAQRINYWKSSRFEKANRDLFNQQSEELFRTRVYQIMDKAPFAVPVREVELFTPEADPYQVYSVVLEKIAKGYSDFSRLNCLIDQYSSRRSGNHRGSFAPYIHWTSVGGFHQLSESEKQFLILKSLALLASHGGGILIDDRDWFRMSQVFRSRVEALSRHLSDRRLFLQHQVLYVGNNQWSNPSLMWKELFSTIGPRAHYLSQPGFLTEDRSARLLVVDSNLVVQRSTLKEILDWIRGGRIALIPKQALYSDAANQILEELIQQSNHRYQIDVGIPYEILEYPGGKAIIYDLQWEERSQNERIHAWNQFMNSMLSLAGIEQVCRVSDSRIHVIHLKRRVGDGKGQGLFVLNHTQRQVSADLLFDHEVSVSDLALSIAQEVKQHRASLKTGRRFQLEIPAFGVLSLSVEGLVDDVGERLDASLQEGAVNGI